MKKILLYALLIMVLGIGIVFLFCEAESIGLLLATKIACVPFFYLTYSLMKYMIKKGYIAEQSNEA